MKRAQRLLLLVITTLLASAAYVYAAESQIFGTMLIPNIEGYGRGQPHSFGPLFVLLQSRYFHVFFLALLAIPVLFAGHYFIMGPKVFSHKGKRIYYFTILNRIIHLFAAISLVILVPTGLMLAFGKYFGGGPLVTAVRQIHGCTTILFCFSVIPMFLVWVKDMLPAWYDIKWFMILGGYLSKKEMTVPAGKFNGGQKVWFWLATFGGVVMALTGAAMYFQDFNYGIAKSLGLSQIDLLRLAAITHNFLAMAIIAFFLTHLYMSLFSIKGTLSSMINGYKFEDEVEHMNSVYYAKLRKKGKI